MHCVGPFLVTKLLENINAVHNTPTIINPKFYMFVVVQSTLYLRVTELFKDQTTLEISAIPLTVSLKSLESDVGMPCGITSARPSHEQPPQPHRRVLRPGQGTHRGQRRV